MGTAEKQFEGSESYVDELSPGTQLLHGQYTIKKFLNAGGFGITYLAKNSLDREVVIKECFPSAFCHRSRSIVQVRSRAHEAELKSVVDLFVQEARSLSRLDHPNIVGVHQVFEDNDTAYMVLDFVEGRDLLDVLEDPAHGLTAEQIKGILRDVLSAVQFIHDQDILHRDISPDNILLDEDLRPVLIDFGAAREEATKQSRVLSALRVVKDGYSPQEFYVQGSHQSPSSDLYALGATFYHLIMGETPPNSQARLAAIAAGEEDPYEPLEDRVKGFDRKFLRAIDKSLGILPKDRMQSAQEWLEIMDGRRNKSRAVTQQLPKSSAAAATMAAERKSSKIVPLMGSAAVVALVAVGGAFVTGMFDAPVPTASSAPQKPAPTQAPTLGAAPATAPTPAPAPVVAPVKTAEVAPAPVAPVEDPVEVAVAPEPVEPAAPIAEAVAVAPTPAPEAKPVVAEVAAPVKPAPQPIETTSADYAVAAFGASDAADMPASVFASTGFTPLPEISDVAPEVMDQIAQTPVVPNMSEETIRSAVLAARPSETNLPDAAAPIAEVSLDNFVLSPDAKVAPEPAPKVEITTVQSDWSVDLPFASWSDGTKIDETGTVAPAWARRGAEIVAVAGTPVTRMSEIGALVKEVASPDENGFVDIAVTVKRSGASNATQERWKVAIIQDTQMPSGLSFSTRKVGGDWVTKVTEVGDADTDLKVGDTLVGFVPTSETITTRTAIADILTREIDAGTDQFSFAVARQGSIWVASMAYVDPASVPTQ